MSAGIRPSSDKPAEEYYFQPWWVKEAIRVADVVSKADLTLLSEKDVVSLKKVAETLKDVLL